jgi:ABC-2 type transport system permease protein
VLAVISLVLAACATSMGLMVASFCKNDRQMRGLTNIIGLVFAALGGCMVPPLLMPDFMKNLAKITPHGWALIGYQDVMVRGAGLEQVVPTLLVLGAFTLVFFGVAMRRMRFAEPN